MNKNSYQNPFFYKIKTLITTLLILFLSFTCQVAFAQSTLITKIPTASTGNDSSKSNNQSTKQWRFLHPYTAHYSVLSKNKKLGKALRKLTKKENLWELSSKASLTKYFLSVKNSEKTQFHYENNQLFTDHFISKTKISFKKTKKMEQTFDWNNKTEKGTRGKKSWVLELKQQTFDRVSHIIQLREDLLAEKKEYSYLVSYKGKLINYEYSIDKTENILSPIGKLSALKLIRTKENGDQFAIWLCPKLNYFPIKIAQYDKGEPDITLLIESLNYD